jgi:hypothetical protein
MCSRGRIEIQFVETNDHLADIVIKPLPRARFQEMKGMIGVATIK